MKSTVVVSLLAVLASGSAFAAEGGGRSWIGGLVGQQKQSSFNPISYGATLGTMVGSVGVEALALTGSKKVGIVDETASSVVGRLDLFAGGKIFYIGPEIGYAKFKATASVAGFSVTAESSALVYGGGGGLNIPLGAASIGADVSYVTGKFNGAKYDVVSYLGTLKLWF